jgi:hypothetical protein
MANELEKYNQRGVSTSAQELSIAIASAVHCNDTTAFEVQHTCGGKRIILMFQSQVDDQTAMSM